MAITFVNKSAFASGTAALTVGAVASVVADDLILLFVESANENIATPTGFTQVTGSPVSTGTAATAGGVRLAVFYKFATGADTTTSVADSGNHTTAIKIAYRGVDLTTPFDATPVTGIKTPASTSTSFPGITTTTANALIVHASALDLDAASTATTGAATNANLTGITERHDQTISGGVGGGLVIVEGNKATAGATGNTTATVTSTIQVYLTLALRELVLAAITGDLSATETGSDTIASTGNVLVQGTAAATETGEDTFAASGTVTDPAIVGTLAATETGSDTATITGAVLVQGTAAATEVGSDTFAATGDVIVQGALSATETGTDTFAATGTTVLTSTGTLAATETGADTLVSTGTVLVKGTAAATETGADTLVATGKVIVQGAAAAVETGADTFASTGKVIVQGAVSATEATTDTAAIAGKVIVQGALAATEVGQDTAAFFGGQAPVTGTLAATEVGSDTVVIAGKVLVLGILVASESGSDTAEATGTVAWVPITGSLNAVEIGLDTAAITGTARIFARSRSDRVAVVLAQRNYSAAPARETAVARTYANYARIDPAVLVAQVATPSLSSTVAAQAQRVTVPV